MKQEVSYYAVIPANVRYSKIPPNAKLLYGEITALCNKYGFCWAKNSYFAELYGKKEPTISVWISHLQREGFISTVIENNNERKIYLKGVLEKSKGGIRKIEREPLEKSNALNNTVNNTINNKYNKGASNEAPSKSSVKFLKSEILQNELELKFPALNIPEEIEKMTDWLKANGKRKKDYAAFARTWCRNAVKYNKENNKRNGHNKGNYDHDEQLRIAREAAEQSLVERRQRAAMFAD
jgi:hypothetical protein